MSVGHKMRHWFDAYSCTNEHDYDSASPLPPMIRASMRDLPLPARKRHAHPCAARPTPTLVRNLVVSVTARQTGLCGETAFPGLCFSRLIRFTRLRHWLLALKATEATAYGVIMITKRRHPLSPSPILSFWPVTSRLSLCFQSGLPTYNLLS